MPGVRSLMNAIILFPVLLLLFWPLVFTYMSVLSLTCPQKYGDAVPGLLKLCLLLSACLAIKILFFIPCWKEKSLISMITLENVYNRKVLKKD